MCNQDLASSPSLRKLDVYQPSTRANISGEAPKVKGAGHIYSMHVSQALFPALLSLIVQSKAKHVTTEPNCQHLKVGLPNSHFRLTDHMH
jgi:hypothetical protein